MSKFRFFKVDFRGSTRNDARIIVVNSPGVSTGYIPSSHTASSSLSAWENMKTFSMEKKLEVSFVPGTIASKPFFCFGTSLEVFWKHQQNVFFISEQNLGSFPCRGQQHQNYFCALEENSLLLFAVPVYCCACFRLYVLS